MLFWLMNIKNEWLTINDKKDILDCNVFWEGKETKMIKKGKKIWNFTALNKFDFKFFNLFNILPKHYYIYSDQLNFKNVTFRILCIPGNPFYPFLDCRGNLSIHVWYTFRNFRMYETIHSNYCKPDKNYKF